MNFKSEQEYLSYLSSKAALPLGFKSYSTRLKFIAPEVNKEFAMNLALITLDQASTTFASFLTNNACPGAPIILAREQQKSETLKAILVNNKISNVYAKNGLQSAKNVVKALANELNCSEQEIICSSTGIIGWQLPDQEIIAALPELAEKRDQDLLKFSQSIMTTDLYPKLRSAKLGSGRITAIAKGAGMVEPNLATMLVYVLTDLKIERSELQKYCADAIAKSFNSISIDTDTSTSDMLIAVSSNQQECSDKQEFANTLQNLMTELAQDVVRNGEGAKHVIEARVTNAPDQDTAKLIGKSIVNSPLVKTAVAGNDPNVGRILMAIGKGVANHNLSLDLNHLEIKIADVIVFKDNEFLIDPQIEVQLTNELKNYQLYTSNPTADFKFSVHEKYPKHENNILIEVNLNSGNFNQTIWGSDLTHEYITENAYYRS